MRLFRYPEHLGTVPLETTRLTLRRFRRNDAAAMFRNWASDPVVTTYLMWTPHTSVRQTKRVLSQWVSGYSNKDHYQWAICEKGNDEPIGSISVGDRNDRLSMVHIGYCLGQKWQGKGYMTECVERVIRFFFKDVKVNRIEARFDPRNPASGRVMVKAGMIFEGTHRQADYNNLGICDTTFYAILAADYRQNDGG